MIYIILAAEINRFSPSSALALLLIVAGILWERSKR
jgi:hypothetical protein